MPLFLEQDLEQIAINQNVIIDPYKPAPEPSNAEIFAAAFRQENTMFNAVDFVQKKLSPSDKLEGFDPFAELEGTKYEEYRDKFADAGNPEQVALLKRRIDRELQDRETLAQGGWTSIAGLLAAGVLDPINFIPLGGVATKIKTAAAIGSKAKAIATGAAATGAVSGLSTAVQEGVLSTTQETRTIHESITNIGASTVLGGILGGSIAGLSKKTVQDFDKLMTVDATPEGTAKYAKEVAQEEFVAQNLSAAAVKKTTMEEETILGGAAQTAAKLFKKLNPTFRLAQSDSLEARKTAQKLMTADFKMTKNIDFIPTENSIEDRLGVYHGMQGFSQMRLDDLFDTYSKRIKINPSPSETKLNRTQFAEEVSLAMVKNDHHAIPEVRDAAKFIREAYFNPIKDRALEAKAFGDDFKELSGETYFPRMYDKTKVTLDGAGMAEAISPYIEQRYQTVTANKPSLEAARDQLIKSEAKAKTKTEKAKIESERIKLEDELDLIRIMELEFEDAGEMATLSRRIVENISNSDPFIRLESIQRSKAGAFKARTLDFVPTEVLRPWLINDVRTVMDRYTKTVAPDIEILKEFGDLNLEKEIKAIRDEYRVKMDKVEDLSKREKIRSKMDADIADIEALVFRLRNKPFNLADPDSLLERASYMVRAWNVVTQLGSSVITNTTDVGRLVAVRGFGKLFSEGIGSFVTNYKAVKLSTEETKLAGQALDTVLSSSRVRSMSDLIELNPGNSKIRSGLDVLTDRFQVYTGVRHLEEFKKKMTGVLTQNEIIESSLKLSEGKELSKKEITFLASNGIDKNTAKMIADQWKRYGKKDRSIYVANTKDWQRKDVAEKYRIALNKQVAQTIVAPTVGTRPLFLDKSKYSGVAKMMLQYESFMLAATSKILVSSLQQTDSRTMASLASMVGLGMMSWATKQKLNKKSLPDDPGTWIYKGVNESGILGILSSIDNKVYSFTGYDAGSFFGSTPSPTRKKDTDRELLKLFMGATYSKWDGAKATVKLLEGRKPNQYDVRAIRNLIPYQNHILLRSVFDEIEESTINSMGIKRRK